MFTIDYHDHFAPERWWPYMQPDRLDRFWRGIVQTGVRQMGSPAVEETLSWIEESLRMLNIRVERIGFNYHGWRLLKPVSVRILYPELRPLAAEAFLYTAGSTHEDLRGRLAPEPSTNQGIWGMYTWERWRIIPVDDQDGRFTLAYLCARPGGTAIPQLLPAGSVNVPHLIIGEPDTTLIQHWRTKGVEIIIEAELHAETLNNAWGENLTAVWQPSERLISGHERCPELLLCAHYDTVYTTSGAYDNASGCALLMELAHLLTSLPKDQTLGLPLLRFVWFGAEELALSGSKEYVEQRRVTNTLSDLVAVINLDGFGRGDVLEIWASPEAASQYAWDCAAYALRRWQNPIFDKQPLNPPQLSLTTPAPPGSDHTPFIDAGIPAIMLTFNDQEIIHQMADSCDPRMLKNMLRAGMVVLSLVSGLSSKKNRILLGSSIQH